MTKTDNGKNCYNIIFAGGNIPPMTALIMSVANGYETYMYTDRGRSFAGIENSARFHNMGFKTDRVQSLDLEQAFVCAVSAVKEIKSRDKNAFFYIYTGESRGLKCAAIAANAGLTKEDFHIIMLEDGIDSYKKFELNYGEKAAEQEIYTFVYSTLYRLTKRVWLSRKTAEKTTDCLSAISRKNTAAGRAVKKYFDRIKEHRFEKSLKKVKKYFKKIMSSQNTKHDDKLIETDYRWPFALSALDNYSYILQDKSKIYSILKGTGNRHMFRIFDLEGEGINSALKVEYRNVARSIAQLTAEQKKEYLGIMFGSCSEDVNKLFTRKSRGEKSAPDRKLVYINARFDTVFVHPVTDGVYGIGAISDTAAFPSSYSQLEDKYKSVFLFENESDWNILSDALNLIDEYKDIPDEYIRRAKAKVFNIYADYVFTIKLLYCLYGEEYDIIVKNHPRADITTYNEWVDFKIFCGRDGYINYAPALGTALAAFHREDTTGRYIGLVDSCLSTECFEYIDADVSFCGQPSSVYNGLSDNAEIPFITVDTDKDITGGDDAHVAYSAVAGRYAAGKMKFTDADGNCRDTVFYNTGNMLKACAYAAEKAGDTNLADMYKARFAKWIKKNYPGAVDINPQGFIVR